MAYEKEVLFPLAGIDPSLSERYHEVQSLISLLAHADNLVAQQYLDKNISREQALALLSEYPLILFLHFLHAGQHDPTMKAQRNKTGKINSFDGFQIFFG